MRLELQELSWRHGEWEQKRPVARTPCQRCSSTPPHGAGLGCIHGELALLPLAARTPGGLPGGAWPSGAAVRTRGGTAQPLPHGFTRLRAAWDERINPRRDTGRASALPVTARVLCGAVGWGSPRVGTTLGPGRCAPAPLCHGFGAVPPSTRKSPAWNREGWPVRRQGGETARPRPCLESVKSRRLF